MCTRSFRWLGVKQTSVACRHRGVGSFIRNSVLKEGVAVDVAEQIRISGLFGEDKKTVCNHRFSETSAWIGFRWIHQCE